MKAEDLLMAINELEDGVVLEANDLPEKKHITARRLSTLLIAAVIAGTLVMTVFASSDGSIWLRNFFAQRSDFLLSDNQKSYIGENAVNIQNSKTRNGYTLTLDTAISDGVYTYIRFQLTAPEDVVLDADYYAPRNWAELDLINEWGKPFVGNAEWNRVEDDPTDNVASLLYIRSHSWDEDNYDSIFGHTWNLRIDGLEGTYVYNSDTPDITVETIDLTEGIWNFAITFPEQGNETVEFITEPVDCICMPGMETQKDYVSITSLKVRALSASLTFRHPDKEEINADFDDIYAVMKDGSMAPLNPASGAPNHLTYQFDAPIVLEDIDHILLPDGTQLPMPQH